MLAFDKRNVLYKLLTIRETNIFTNTNKLSLTHTQCVCHVAHTHNNAHTQTDLPVHRAARRDLPRFRSLYLSLSLALSYTNTQLHRHTYTLDCASFCIHTDTDTGTDCIHTDTCTGTDAGTQ